MNVSIKLLSRQIKAPPRDQHESRTFTNSSHGHETDKWFTACIDSRGSHRYLLKRRLSVLRIGLDALCKRTSLSVPRNRNQFARFSGTDGSPVTMLTGLLQPFTSEFSLDYLNIPLYFKIHFVPWISLCPSFFFRVLNPSHSFYTFLHACTHFNNGAFISLLLSFIHFPPFPFNGT
jgi:hypothetical protein